YSVLYTARPYPSACYPLPYCSTRHKVNGCPSWAGHGKCCHSLPFVCSQQLGQEQLRLASRLSCDSIGKYSSPALAYQITLPSVERNEVGLVLCKDASFVAIRHRTHFSSKHPP